MSVTPKSGKHVHGDSESPSPSPLSGSGPGGHKASFRGTKLARRARSFKEDFLEKISQMRSPATTHTGRSHSPKGRGTTQKQDEDTVDKGPTIEILVRQVEVALKHFRDVISKKKLEMLSGNGTIVLDNVYLILSALKPLISNDRSSTVSSATNQVYQCLTKLIKLCDDVMIHGDKSSALDHENVGEIVTLLEDAVQNLVKISQDKLLHRDSGYKTAPRASYGNANLEHPAQRNSLPDIPLTPQDRLNLEQTSCTPGLVRSSHSSESILRDSSPPPKPPLPDRLFVSICLSEPDSNSLGTPPPLPPKKRNQRTQQLIGECCNSDSSLLACSLDRMSLRSRSPEDSSSLLSASAGSLDSVLNHSREEEEIKALMDHHNIDDGARDNDLSEHIIHDGSYPTYDTMCGTQNMSFLNHSDIQVMDNNRLSNADSGFVSIHSHRNSVQSYSTSKRSSQQSSSSQWSQQNSFKQVSSNTFSQQSSVISNESIIQKSESIMTENKIIESSFEKSVTASNISQFSSLSGSHVSDLLHNLESIDSVDNSLTEDSIPPAIPQKTRSRRGRYERQPSPYDNVPDNMGGELLVTCQMHQSQSKASSVRSSMDIEDEPPPLPVKKRHIMAYMEMFGNCTHSSDNEYLRHSVHMVQQWQNQKSLDSGLTSTQSCSFMQSSSHTLQHSTLALPTTDQCNILSNSSPTKLSALSNNGVPPALPPKRSRASSNKSNTSPPPASPTAITSTPNHHDHKLTPKIMSDSNKSERTSPISVSTPVAQHKMSPGDVSSVKSSEKSESELVNIEVDLMEEIDITKYLVFKKPEEEGPDIRGGYIDALIVHATKCNKKDYSYQEAFLTTYRTFISPFELIVKLVRRHQYFICQPEKKPRAREAFSLLVSVVNDLTAIDLEDCLTQALMEFIYQLVTSGNLDAAKPLRIKLIEKYMARQAYMLSLKKSQTQETSLSLAAGSATLLDFKSEQIAEQMTLLDANLFMKIEIPEVLIWAQEQNEERSPNLTKFTEHFNKMSYWARTKILSPQDPREREKFVMKFIKIMKHLRKINNFNSYLALLSALDSAPIRRLEWQKHITEGLKEYCALIDSSSSFRAYRQALAETTPPCIPYIGLVLQDLTFVHIGNSNLLPDGTINFSKRWQQFNIVENMKRFKKCTYTFKKNERIIAFFDNFQENIGEDAMWQLSESYKPRGGKKSAP